MFVLLSKKSISQYNGEDAYLKGTDIAKYLGPTSARTLARVVLKICEFSKEILRVQKFAPVFGIQK